MATSSDATMVDAPESEVPVLEYVIDDDRVSSYFDIMTRGARIEPVTLIETDFLKKLLDYCTKQLAPGVAIRGPSGTGKSTSSLYLWKKLRNRETPIPLLVCSPQCLKPIVFNPYIESFCKENSIGEEMCNTCNPPLEMLKTILMTQKRRKPSPVFFVDLCCVTKDQKKLPTIVELAIKAMRAGWYVVVAYSSGGGETNDRSTPELVCLRSNLETLDTNVDHLESTVFNDKEASKFVDKFNVDVEGLEEVGIEVANNPYLLHLFSGTVANSCRFDIGVRGFWYKITELTRTFVSTVHNPVYTTAFNDCLALLECARHNIALNSTQLQQYKRSYLHQEHLTTLEGDEHGRRIKLLFPPMYNEIVKQLKVKFEEHEEKVLALPVIKGYVFESSFLQCKDLHRLTISAVMEEAEPPKNFAFSSLISASVQESGPINHDLIDNQICHLRPKHPAIDGVCVAVDSNNVRYLLLLQVSISEYRKHESKGIDIRKQVDQKFEGKVRSGTIAEYYKNLARVQDKNVIYVYVSPREVQAPSHATFSQELKRHATRDCPSSPQYFYGFCVDSNRIIERCSPD